MIDTFLKVSMSSITTQRLGKIVLRTPAVGVIMWCLYVFPLSHAPSPARCLLRG